MTDPTQSEFEAGDVVLWNGDLGMWFMAQLEEDSSKSDEDTIWNAAVLHPGTFYTQGVYLDENGESIIPIGHIVYVKESALTKIQQDPTNTDWSDLPQAEPGWLSEMDQDMMRWGQYLDGTIRVFKDFQSRGYPSFNLNVETAAALHGLNPDQLVSLMLVAINRLAADKIELPDLS